MQADLFEDLAPVSVAVSRTRENGQDKLIITSEVILPERQESNQNISEKVDAGLWQAWFDGATGPGNPGESGIGVVLRGPQGELVEISRYIGFGTNNEAEYHSLIALLEWAVEHGVRDLIVRGDSQLVVYQADGKRQPKAENLKPLLLRVKQLSGKIGAVRFEWIPREQNKDADRLSQLARKQKESAPMPVGEWLRGSDMARCLSLTQEALEQRLQNAGLRKGVFPSGKALNEKYAQVEAEGDYLLVLWNRKKVSAIINASLPASTAMAQVKTL